MTTGTLDMHDLALDADRLACHFRPRLLLFLHARTGDPELAEDIAQDVLIAVIAALDRGQLRETASLPAFVFAVARNHLASALRRKMRAREEPLESAAGLVSGPIDIVGQERRSQLRKAVAEMDEKDRRILHLSLTHGYTPEVIAAHVGLSQDAVRQRKSRALRRIAHSLRMAES